MDSGNDRGQEWRLTARVEGAVPAGEVILDVRASREAIDELVQRLRALELDVRPSRLGPAVLRRATLTPAQDEAVRLAFAQGYYRIPRSLNLCELASKGGISAAAMSERLRRAEARIVASYMGEGVPVVAAASALETEQAGVEM